MFIREIQAVADNEIVERFQGGFVKRFMDHCHCIVGPYTRLISNKVQTPVTGKFCILFSDQFSTPKPEALRFPMRIRWPFDFAQYVASDACQKKLAILEGVHSACSWMLKGNGWDSLPFEKARQTLLDRNLEWIDISKRQWVHPDKKIKVRIAMRLDLEKFDLFLIVYANRTVREISRIPVRAVYPCENWDYRYLRRAHWTSANQLTIDTCGLPNPDPRYLIPVEVADSCF